MPVYEFYCPGCHTIYSFFSRKVNTEKRPPCPGCGKGELERKLSGFATISKSKNGGEEHGELPIDESKMEKAMESLAGEAEGMDENDPRAAAKLMRKLSDATGLQYGENMEQALSRLEAGEDPESVEADMGELMDGDEDPFIMPGAKGGGKAPKAPPRRDETLYDM